MFCDRYEVQAWALDINLVHVFDTYVYSVYLGSQTVFLFTPVFVYLQSLEGGTWKGRTTLIWWRNYDRVIFRFKCLWSQIMLNRATIKKDAMVEGHRCKPSTKALGVSCLLARRTFSIWCEQDPHHTNQTPLKLCYSESHGRDLYVRTLISVF